MSWESTYRARGRWGLVFALCALCALSIPGPVTAQTAARPAAVGALPPDVHPDTRNRLPPIARAQLDERGRRAFDAALQPGDAAPRGVAAIRLYRSGVDVRWDSPLGRRLTELAILVGAREHDQPYEWSLHEMEALSVGLEPSIIDLVKNRRPLSGLGDRETAIIETGRELFRDDRLSAATYARALKTLGQTNLVDIVDLMANYAGTAANLTAANQWLPPQMKQFLPLPFTMPDDIDPQSRSRIPMPPPRAAGTRAGSGDGGAGGAGEGAAGLYRRTLAPPPTGPGSMGRFAAGLPSLEASVGRPLVHLAALATAREHNQQYDWTMTEVAALKDGLDTRIVDVARQRKALDGVGEREAVVIQFARELFGQHYVTTQTYARALKVFGLRDLSDLVTGVMAQHARDATLLSAFDQQLPAGQVPLLPLP